MKALDCILSNGDYKYFEYYLNHYRIKVWTKSIYAKKDVKYLFNKVISENIDVETIYDVRNRLYLVEKDTLNFVEEDIIIKEFGLHRKYDQIRFRFLKSKAFRSINTAVRLEKIGIKTPEPLLAVEIRGNLNKLVNSYYISNYIDYDYNLLDIIREDRHPVRKKVVGFLPYIAKDIRKMHDAGIIHNDLHAGNILIKFNNKVPGFYYIDLNRARFKKRLSITLRMRDLARFDLNDDELNILIANYDSDNYKRYIHELSKEKEKRQRLMLAKRSLRNVFKNRQI